ncbi:twin-arginine translocation pathway signal protein [Stutzerimonas stutzeri]|uniref:twin-arginine translocation pathway signal protein n=1 Tax=Stutzerimonas sp. S1 TaxID=3030652 RepID=UPI0022246BD5|nr:twin-arginine translocation pathway signal protein [Stutzerimonas sp. S1]MCW3147504.1 twin-arginine translocation pathway signal protein [Stutzerimonas sp. S1]
MAGPARAPAGLSLSRRGLLRIGLLGGVVLTTSSLAASLGGCSREPPAQGFALLRTSDLPLLQRLIPLVLAGAVATPIPPAVIDGTLSSLDRSLEHLSPALAKQVLQLFDLLGLPLARGPLTGIWGSWDAASDQAMQAFLQRWQNSPLALLRQGHNVLLQLVLMAWYGRPEAWAHCGYPGPPAV